MVCKQTCEISKKVNGDPFWKKIEWRKCPGKKEIHISKKNQNVSEKNELEKSPFTFLEKRFAVVFSKKNVL